MSVLLMLFLCIPAWDALVNGKLYYCTDGGTMDFIFVGDWVHHPEPVAHVVSRPMDPPDEIKAGWSITGLWCLWGEQVIRLLFERVQKECGIAPQDLEMTIFETPKHNWGFRGLPGDEHKLNYKVEV